VSRLSSTRWMRNIKEAIADRTADNIQSKVAPAIVQVGADRKTN
jgi:hypothetical protein